MYVPGPRGRKSLRVRLLKVRLLTDTQPRKGSLAQAVGQTSRDFAALGMVFLLSLGWEATSQESGLVGF